MQYKLQETDGTIYNSPDGNNFVLIPNVIQHILVQRFRTGDGFQGNLQIDITDVAGEDAIKAQGPAVITEVSRAANAMTPPQKRIRTNANDIIKIFNGGTLVKTINAVGPGGTFGIEGDAAAPLVAG